MIKINYKTIRKGQKEIIVENVFANSQTEIAIKLDPALSVNENAEAYFKKYRKGREGLALLERRLEISFDELAQWQNIHVDLEAHFNNAKEKYRAEIASILSRKEGGKEESIRLPYREHTLSTGLTVYVGRDGSDNDRTTFEFARPYELWFHTQQCAGSHVVMKFPGKSFEPSKREIEEAASLAAWHSKARNDSLVPVAYTQRKYVRKPRKAKPGLVTIEREKSVMVAPVNPKR